MLYGAKYKNVKLRASEFWCLYEQLNAQYSKYSGVVILVFFFPFVSTVSNITLVPHTWNKKDTCWDFCCCNSWLINALQHNAQQKKHGCPAPSHICACFQYLNKNNNNNNRFNQLNVSMFVTSSFMQSLGTTVCVLSFPLPWIKYVQTMQSN